jgi:hypothetical protein
VSGLRQHGPQRAHVQSCPSAQAGKKLGSIAHRAKFPLAIAIIPVMVRSKFGSGGDNVLYGVELVF